MPNNDMLRDFLQGFQFQVPYLFFYLIGILCSFIFWRRYPLVCVFTFFACVIKALASIAFPLSAAILFRIQDFQTFETVSLVIAVLDAAAYALLLLAIFSGRAVVMERRLPRRDVEPDDGATPSTSPEDEDNTGIQVRK
jgi:hypothetical protein